MKPAPFFRRALDARHAVPRHAHHGTEEVVVLSATVTIGGVEMSCGDYLFTIPGEEHDVVALPDAVIFVSSQKSTPVA
jgi:quercetin dioxygenase-like cupin family protein